MRRRSITWMCSLFMLCQSFLVLASYESQTSYEKLDHLWQKVEGSEYAEKPELSHRSWGQILVDLRSLLSLGFTFNCVLDELRSERIKFIHRYGSVAKAEWVPNEATSYTGLLSSGADVIVRLSLAADPENGVIPGMALKFLVDGQQSRNLVVMNSLEGQGEDTNFFAKEFTHQIASPSSFSLKLVESIFSWVHNPPGDLPISHLAQVDRHGQASELMSCPDQLVFRPHASVNQRISSNSKNDFRLDLESIPADSVLYDVVAINCASSVEESLGQIVLKSAFKSSSFGDKHLFFQHHH